MAEFKAIISNPKDGKSYKRDIKGHHANSLIGKKIGDEVDGIFVSLPGYKLIITGGSDKEGFPMRKDLTGPRRTKLLISESTGFHPRDRGIRRRKNVRGNTISSDIVQINFKIKSVGARPIEELFKAEGKKK